MTSRLTASPWLGHYDAGVPATTAPYPDRTLLDCVAEAARDHGGAPAVLFKGSALSYGALDRLSDAFAAALRAAGVARGDRVAVLLPNCPQFLVAQLGAWKAGAIVSPLNPLYTERELEVALRENGIATIVTLTRFYERVKHVQPRTGLRTVVATNIKEHFPPLLRVLFTLFRERRDGDRIDLRPGDLDFVSLLAAHAGEAPPRVRVGPGDPAVLLMSGGTTGVPKGVLGTHGAYLRAGMQIRAWLASVLGEGDSTILLPLPLFHVYANVGVQALALLTRNPLALVPNPRDLDDLLATIRRVRPAFFCGVPSLYVALLNHRDVQRGRADFRSIRICFSGAAPLLADTKTRFEAITGGRIVEGYSLTEGMMALCVNPVKGPNKIGSVGLPLPDVHVRIVDGETGTRELPAGEVGEICLAAPQLMEGFWNRPEETADVLRTVPGSEVPGPWLHTGDLGYLDEDGYLFIVDRKKDLIKASGNQVWPREVEEALASHPAVAEVGVAGVPDELKGEAVKAWIVLRPGWSASVEELRSHCRGQLAPYKVPSLIEFRTELPKTMVGKVLRRALKADHVAAGVSRSG
jgi:long-chain acyl-CoA synthetase